MSANVEQLEKNKVKIDLCISKEDFNAAMMKSYQKNKGRFNVPGFRKGKAPKPIIENYYGEGVFYEDAFDIAFPEAYSKAIEENKLEPVSRPDITINKMSSQEGCEFSVTIDVKPEVELGDYKGVEVEKVSYRVLAKDIDSELERVQQQNARFVEVDREAKEGDKVIIDFAGSVDGKLFEGGSAEGQSLDLGSKTFIPGFEEQIEGMKVGEEKDITVTFPEDYHAEELKGKEAVFHIKLHDIKEKQLPELDDEFASEVSEFETLEEYKKDIKKKLKEQNDRKARTELEDRVLTKVSDNAKVDIPDSMIQSQIDYQMQEMEYSLMYQGLKLDDYLKYTNMTRENLREQYRDSAEKRVKMQLVLEAVKNAEGMEATDEDVEKEIEELAKQANKSVEEYKKLLGGQDMAYFKDRAEFKKLVDFLVDNAVQVPKNAASK